MQLGSPNNLLIFWESGGISRPNDDEVIGQCDLIAEREPLQRKNRSRQKCQDKKLKTTHYDTETIIKTF
jgi:hypothetical protein